ncbi:MAG: hypothetical protein SPE99_03265 [Blautia sp.]|nr:hypothetical protein [Blautia sp.]
MELNKLVPSLRETIFEPTYEITSEYLEMGIDTLFDNEVLRNIPLVSTLSAFCKVGYNLHERYLIKQTIAFIKGFSEGTIPQDKLEKHRVKLESNPKETEKELGRILIILGSQIESNQSQVLGSFYKAYISGAISWQKFCELSEANRRMFIGDYRVLCDTAKNNGLKINDRKLYQIDRLISLGLLQNQNRLGSSIVALFETGSKQTKDIIVTSFGKTFYQHLPKGIYL